MTSISISHTTTAVWKDYLEMCKPKVVALMLLTTVIGMFLATPGMVPWPILLWGNLGIAFSAGSAAVINHLVDRKVDAAMSRTTQRPLPQQRIQPLQATVFALVLGVLGMSILVLLVNSLTAWLTLASLIGYAVIYTMFLKRATPQNIVIGGLAGAAPPLLGWTAVTNQIDAEALLLVLIIFAWTPPHFWALALHRKEEYSKVNIPMLPVTHGDRFTRLHTLLYTIILCVVSILPFIIGMSGLIYLVSTILLDSVFLYWALVLFIGKDIKAPMATFKYSILYLMLLFVALLLDHYFKISLVQS